MYTRGKFRIHKPAGIWYTDENKQRGERAVPRQRSGADFPFSDGYFALHEEAAGPELYRVGWYDGPLPQESRQDTHRLWLLEEGAAVLEVDGEERPLVRSHPVFVSRGRRCALRPSGAPLLRCYALEFSLDGCREEPSLRDLYRFYEEAGSVCEAEDGHGTKTAFARLLGELYEQTVPTLLRRYLVQLLVCAYRDFTAASPQQRLPGATGLAVGYTTYAVVRYVDAHLCEPDLLSGLALALGYNYQYLSHLFRRKTGMTLRSYVISRRIAQAKTWLQEGELTVTEIARRLQYQSASTFNQSFRREVGCSPAVYRAQMGYKARGTSLARKGRGK